MTFLYFLWTTDIIIYRKTANDYGMCDEPHTVFKSAGFRMYMDPIHGPDKCLRAKLRLIRRTQRWRCPKFVYGQNEPPGIPDGCNCSNEVVTETLPVRFGRFFPPTLRPGPQFSGSIKLKSTPSPASGSTFRHPSASSRQML